MKVTETGYVRAQIEKYKRFLEKPELFNHSAMMNDRQYYLVQYWRLGKKEAVGYLVLRPDGDVVLHGEALPVVRLFLSHNLAAHKMMNDFATDKDKPVWMYEQKRDHLQALLPQCESRMDSPLREDVRQLMHVCEKMVESRERLQRIYDQGMNNIKAFFARGYTVPEDEEILRGLLFESDYILYDRLRAQALIRDSVDRLLAYFSDMQIPLDQQLAKKRSELISLLRTYKDKNLRDITDQSIRSFEMYTADVPVPFRSAEHLTQVYQKQNEIVFQKTIPQKLRNP